MKKYLALTIILFATISTAHSDFEPIPYCDLTTTIEQFLEIAPNNIRNNKCEWLIEKPDKKKDMFIQGIKFSPGERAVICGDLHGDIDSLDYIITYWKSLEDNPYLIFIGDYADRGCNGIEVWYTIMNLKIMYPNQIIIMRGNHENENFPQRGITLELEIQAKYNKVEAYFIYEDIKKAFNSIPVLTQLILNEPKTDYYRGLILCHGGISRSFDPTPIFEKLIFENRKNIFSSLNNCWTGMFKPELKCGILWSDFFANSKKHQNIARFEMSKRSTNIVNYSKYAANAYFIKHSFWSWKNHIQINSIDEIEKAQKLSAIQHPSKLNYIEHLYSNDTEEDCWYDNPLLCIQGIIRGHQHVPGGVVKLRSIVDKTQTNKKLKHWKPLQNEQTEEIKNHSIYSISSFPYVSEQLEKYSIHPTNIIHVNAFAVLEAGHNGLWYFTPHIEPIHQCESWLTKKKQRLKSIMSAYKL